MEKGCILPHGKLKKINNPDHIVISQMARFCKNKSEDIIEALILRNTKERKIFKTTYHYGYRRYNKKNGKKIRVIRAPHPLLQEIQLGIQKQLMSVPVSFASTASKLGNSASKNAEIHRHNRYLLTLDIKNAYPSINTRRVYTNLAGAIGHNLRIRCPLLENPEDKEYFIRALTHLCMSENELPQWASTSNHIQNIVLTATDIAIEKTIPNLIWHNMQYSRYADDITISFPHIITMEVLQEKCSYYIKQLHEIQNSNQKENLKQIINEFRNNKFIVSDNYELTYLQDSINTIKWIIKKIPNSIVSEQDRYAVIGIIDKYKEQIKYSWLWIDAIKDEIIDIIGKQWRKVNMLKVKTWTPQSNNDREINGMAFDNEGKRKLGKKKRAAYIRFFKDIYKKSLEELWENLYYRQELRPKEWDGKLNIGGLEEQKAVTQRIIGKLKGMWWHLIHIYEGQENINKELTKYYQKAYDKRSNFDPANNKTEKWDDLWSTDSDLKS